MRLVKVDATNVAYCVALCKELMELSSFKTMGYEFDWQFTMQAMQRFSVRHDCYLYMSQLDDGEYTGFVGGHVEPFFFSPRLFGLENAWYVRKLSQGRTIAAIRLMRGFMKWATEEHGVTLIQSGDVAAINSIAVDRLYRHLGFKRFGVIYSYTKE
jgi:hypothetical protein